MGRVGGGGRRRRRKEERKRREEEGRERRRVEVPLILLSSIHPKHKFYPLIFAPAGGEKIFFSWLIPLNFGSSQKYDVMTRGGGGGIADMTQNMTRGEGGVKILEKVIRNIWKAPYARLHVLTKLEDLRQPAPT